MSDRGPNLGFATLLIPRVSPSTSKLRSSSLTCLDIPIRDLVANPATYISHISPGDTEVEIETYVVCRLGNDSQIAVEALRNAGAKGVVKDLIGGLRAWAKEVDNQFPVY